MILKSRTIAAALGIGLVFGAAAINSGCHREVTGSASESAALSRNQPSEASTSSANSSAVKPVAHDAPKPFKRVTAPGRIVAIGDLHGDLAAAQRALRVAKVIDAADHWIGGNSVVVQTGDLIDRGDDDRALLEWMERLAPIAEAGGGAVYRLNGNHEVMNVAGDLRYVSEKGFSTFAEYARGPLPAALAEAPVAQRGRLAAFLPGGPWARRLAQYPVVLVVNDTVFAHGGLLAQHVEYGLERINSEVSAWMRGSGKLGSLVGGDDSPFWNRTFGDSVSDADCQKLSNVLADLGSKRLVVGHTPQKHGITFACEAQVVRIDVGLSSFYGHHPASVLEINSRSVVVLTEGATHPSTATAPLPKGRSQVTQVSGTFAE